MLAITSSCTKRYSRIYGKQVIWMNQCLVSIKLKEPHKILNYRLRRLQLKCLLYELVIKYLPGREIYIADLLSWNYLKRVDKGDKVVADVVYAIYNVQIDFKNDKRISKKNWKWYGF